MNPYSLSYCREDTKSIRESDQSDLMSGNLDDLDGLRALDHQVIAAVHKRFFPEIFRYVRYRLGNEIIAEDITGETFTRLLESVYSGGGPRTNLRGWLIGTASNLVNDHLRKFYAHPTELLPEDLHDDGPSPTQYSEQTDRNRQINDALTKLTPDQQQVIALRFGGGYSLKETAALMKKNENAIKALQFRALAALRRSFGVDLL
jgi:RNA polymerase sigma-70 factor (ECF subfamily)